MLKTLLNKYEEKTVFLLSLGLLAALFFSITFLINRAISLDGGHWYWSASLRFFFSLLFLSIGFILFKGLTYFKSILKEYLSNFKFWTITGTVGFGFFYSLICYAAYFSPAWVVATTWQITILASLFVLSFFGRKLSKKIWIYTTFIFLGVSIVNFSHFDINNWQALLLGFFPVLIAAISYPIGNQMVWEEKKRRSDNNINLGILNNAFAKVFLMTLGSFPLWIILYFITSPGSFSSDQAINVAIISLFSGVIASSLFLYVRSKANTPSKLMLVDVSASGEVIFALGGEILFLNALLPSSLGFIGIIITVISIIFLAKSK